MKAKVRLYDNDKESEIGFPIKVILSHERRTRRKTISHAKASQWNFDHHLPKPSHPDYEDLYEYIGGIVDKSQKRYFLELHDFDTAFAHLLRQQQKTTSFYDYAEGKIKQLRTPNKKGVSRQGNANAYATAVNELQKFMPDLSFKEMTPALLERFKEHKRNEGAKNTTLKNYISELRAIYNSAVREGVTEDKRPFNGIFHDVKVRRRRAANAYFSKETIKRLETLELSGAEKRTLDLTLLQFYLGGASLVDVYYLKWEYVHNDRVFFPTRLKLLDRGAPFDVKIFPQAWEIINRYKTDEGEYVFPWPKDYTRYKSFRDNFNKRYLRNIQKKFDIELEPKGGSLSSKVIRHTFATLGKFQGIQEDVLRELMGHERNDIDTVYKDKYPEAERDAAHLEIIS